MLELSRTINPGVEHVVGDMRSLRLGTTFDAVLIHDAICYLTTEDDLRATLATVRAHLRPGGVTVLQPDHVRETFAPGTDHGGEDAPGGTHGRGLRYLEWTIDPDPEDTTYQVDYALLLRHEDGRVEVRHDRHIEGLFPIATWLRLLTEAGFEAEARDDGWDRTLFVGRRTR